jgi:hypothetical protein
MQASSVVPQTQRSIERDRIAAVERLIRPYVRHRPTITVDAQDFGLDAAPLVMKLEFLQHTGSFKPRGAFAQPADPSRSTGRRNSRVGRQSRRRGRLCRNAARYSRDDLCAARHISGKDRWIANTRPSEYTARAGSTRALRSAASSERSRRGAGSPLPIVARHEPRRSSG